MVFISLFFTFRSSLFCFYYSFDDAAAFLCTSPTHANQTQIRNEVKELRLLAHAYFCFFVSSFAADNECGPHAHLALRFKRKLRMKKKKNNAKQQQQHRARRQQPVAQECTHVNESYVKIKKINRNTTNSNETKALDSIPVLEAQDSALIRLI